MTRFLSRTIASTISTVPALGAYHALVPISFTTSPPPALARSTHALMRSALSRSVTGMPLTLVRRGSGTMSSPCPPSSRPWMSSTLTPSSHARKVLYRATSRAPA